MSYVTSAYNSLGKTNYMVLPNHKGLWSIILQCVQKGSGARFIYQKTPMTTMQNFQSVNIQCIKIDCVFVCLFVCSYVCDRRMFYTPTHVIVLTYPYFYFSNFLHPFNAIHLMTQYFNKYCYCTVITLWIALIINFYAVYLLRLDHLNGRLVGRKAKSLQWL